MYVFFLIDMVEYFPFATRYGIIAPMSTLVILAGGKSTRMGKDKIFLKTDQGAAFIDVLYRSALKRFDQVIIAAGNPDHGAEIRKLLPEAEIIPDRYDAIGPMGGILSVYEQMGIHRFAVIPADVPGAELRVPAFFVEQCGDELCMLKTKGKAEPLIAAYGKNALCRMKRMAEQGSYSLQNMVTKEAVLYSEEDLKKVLPELKETDFEAAFYNINTEQDYLGRIKKDRNSF